MNTTPENNAERDAREHTRDERGRLLPGCTANPKGENGYTKPFVPWKVRVEQLERKYDSVEKLMALFEVDPATQRMRPTREFQRMNPFDAGIVWQMIGQVSGDDKRMERESFWDRREGKPMQRNELTGKDGSALFNSDRDYIESKLLSPLESEGTKTEA